VWNGHLARQQARSLFHYLTINYAYLLTTFYWHRNQKPLKCNLLEEIAMLLNVRKTENSLSDISAYNPDFAKKKEIARRGIKKYRNALIELAK
jgi:hypothetical protein